MKTISIIVLGVSAAYTLALAAGYLALLAVANDADPTEGDLPWPTVTN